MELSCSSVTVAVLRDLLLSSQMPVSALISRQGSAVVFSGGPGQRGPEEGDGEGRGPSFLSVFVPEVNIEIVQYSQEK